MILARASALLPHNYKRLHNPVGRKKFSSAPSRLYLTIVRVMKSATTLFLCVTEPWLRFVALIQATCTLCSRPSPLYGRSAATVRAQPFFFLCFVRVLSCLCCFAYTCWRVCRAALAQINPLNALTGALRSRSEHVHRNVCNIIAHIASDGKLYFRVFSLRGHSILFLMHACVCLFF